MSLTNEQKQTLSQQLAAGASLADIQRTVNEEFAIKMTYMEIKFLIDDLEIEIPEPEPEPEVEEEEKPETAAAPEGDGTVKVELDKIKRPGAALSGEVTFSDGVKAMWYVDQTGRLGLDPSQEDYQPSEEDIQEFQIQLRQLVQGPQL